MSKRIAYSDSEDFLIGLIKGIELVNDSSLTPDSSPSVSDNTSYAFMVEIDDDDGEEDWFYFFNGSSYDYSECSE
jgi:hypothetical protein